ncbi:MAG: cupin domain-containing protein [Anaerolineae bacterium]
MKRVEKPWGEELWVTCNEAYALKIIRLNQGFRSSLQYHNRKRETIYVDDGVVNATLEDELGRLVDHRLEPGSVIDNPPLRKHRVEALTDARLIEVSTPDLDDVVRLDDDYGR